MADILSFPGSGENAGVTPPLLQNTIFPANNGFGGQVSLGMGRMTRRFANVNLPGDDGASDVQLQALYMALSQTQQNNASPNLSVDLRGLRGPAGIPGRTVINYGNPGGGGSPGVSGKTVVLSATQQVFVYDGDGNIVGGQTITFTANTDNCSGDFTWTITSPIGGTSRSFTSGGGTSDSTATLSGSDFDGWAEDNAEISVTRNGITDTMDIYKVADGTDAVTVVLSATQQVFTYDGDGNINAGQTITFTANSQNGSGDYTWALTSPAGGTVRAFSSGGGTSDSTATLTGADFDGWAEDNARVTVTRSGVTDVITLYKVTDGTTAITLRLSATALTYTYDQAGLINAGQSITFTADSQNGSGNYTWAVTAPSGGTVRAFTSGGGVSDTTAVISGADFDGWGQTTMRVACTRNGITDTIEVIKIQDGTNIAAGTLTNENHTFPADHFGNIDAGDYAAGICDIVAFIGTTQLTYAASGASTYSLGTLVHSPAAKITITESTVSSQRRLTPSAFDADTDLVVITVPIHIRDAAGTESIIEKVLTYGKSKGGLDAVVGFLTNENHTFPSDYFGNVDAGDYAAGICDVQVYEGSTQLNYAISGASTYSLGTLVHDPAAKITITESTVSSQRRLTPSAFDADTDLVIITVPIHIRDAAGTETILERVLTYGKSKDGYDAVVGFLTNENHSFPSDYFGNVDAGDYAAGICDIQVYEGSTQLNYAASGASTYSLGTLVHSPAAKITITESTVSSQRRLTPSAFDADTDLVIITVPIHIRDAAGTETILERVLTYGKSKDGYDSIVAFLTNENHSFPATSAGVVDAGDYAAGICDINVYIGTTQIQYHASDPSTYSLGTLVHSPASKITITESTVSNQRRLTPSAFDSATDLVAITVPINVRDAAGTVVTFNRVLTYGKNKAGADGIDAFDDIDIPIPYDGWEGAFTDDDPGAGSVSWTSFKVKYQGSEHTVAASNTANPYLYWDSSSPTAVSSTATKSTVSGDGKFMIGWNNSGTFTPSQFFKLITAGFIDVTVLSALAADIGTCTAGTLTGGIIRTAASGARVELDGASATKQIAAYNSSAEQTFQVKDDGSGFWGKISGGIYPIAVSAAGAVTIRGDKLTITGIGTSAIDALAITAAKLGALAAETAKIDDSATHIVTRSYGASGYRSSGSYSTLTYAAHSAGGDVVECAGGAEFYNRYALSVDIGLRLYYNGVLIAEQTFENLPSGNTTTLNVAAPVASASGSKNVGIDCMSTAPSSPGNSTVMSQGYAQAIEYKGK